MNLDVGLVDKYKKKNENMHVFFYANYIYFKITTILKKLFYFELFVISYIDTFYLLFLLNEKTSFCYWYLLWFWKIIVI